MIAGVSLNHLMAFVAIAGVFLGVGGNIKTIHNNTKDIEKVEVKMDKSEKIQIKQTIILEGVVETQKEQNKVLKKLLEK